MVQQGDRVQSSPRMQERAALTGAPAALRIGAEELPDKERSGLEKARGRRAPGSVSVRTD